MITRLLFVDDERFLMDGIRRLLSRRRPDWQLTFADSGPAALEALKSEKFDIVVSDMRMPGMDGVALLERVRDLDASVVRIMLSGQIDREAVFSAEKMAHQFLTKPFEIGLLEATLDRLCCLRQLMVDPTLQQIVGRPESLPSVPKVYTDLVELLAQGEMSHEGVAEILRQNPASGAKILQMVRSAFSGTHVDVHALSVGEAVEQLGLNVMKCVALMAGAFVALEQKAETTDFAAVVTLEHSLSVAHASAMILRGNAEADNAFMAGMLHDFGKLVLEAMMPEVARRIGIMASNERQPTYVLEREQLNTTHAEIGGYLLANWGLPRTVVEAVAYHHSPIALTSPELDAATAVHIGDVLVREFDHGPEAGCPVSMNWEYLELAGVTDRVAAWRESIRDLTEAAV